jgi:hypothetical protein
MVNATRHSIAPVLLLAAIVLLAAAWLRGAEYDEQYTLFLTAGSPRPAWPDVAFPAGRIAAIQAGYATMASIGRDLRTTDVHPPLYFWAVCLWRFVAGPSLFAARLPSVLCGLVSLAMVGVIARRCGIRSNLAMLLTLGSYGFVYTNAVARGFAPAQALTLCGVALLSGRPNRIAALAAGALFGAATACNYLAVFAGAAVCLVAGAWLALPAALPFLALDAWFFAAQHGARDGQFPSFSLLTALPRLLAYAAANLFGGLPLYASGLARLALGGLIGILTLALAAMVLRARPLAAGHSVRMLLTAALATPAGLLLLGVVFDNTPIELRYLSFSAPFAGLLLAWGYGRCRVRILLAAVLLTQCAAITGLLLAPQTMQPARMTAGSAAALAQGGVVLLPRGNDGVGIVGAFGIEAPPDLPILLVSPTEFPAELSARIAPYRRVVLALLAQDRDSAATLPIMREALAGSDWHPVAAGYNTQAFERAAR